MGDGSLSPYTVKLVESSSQPLTVRRGWQTARVTRRDAVGNITGSAKWNATIVLTHTPG